MKSRTRNPTTGGWNSPSAITKLSGVTGSSIGALSPVYITRSSATPAAVRSTACLGSPR